MRTMKLHLFIVAVAVVMIGCASSGSDERTFTDRMAVEHRDDQPVQNKSVRLIQNQPVTAKMVSYGRLEGKEVKGYLAIPKSAEPGGGELKEDLPGLIVIHEWWGLNENIKMMTRRLAGEGYAALAVDLYHGRVAQNPQEAREYMQEVSSDPQRALNNLQQALKYLDDDLDTEDLGLIGWCFGGGWSLRAALEQPDEIDAVVMYYGQLVHDMDRMRRLDMPLLGIFGAEDHGIPVAEVKEFEKTLDLIGVDAEVHIYEGAGHAFANPSGNRYNEVAAKDAWQRTVTFLNEHLD